MNPIKKWFIILGVIASVVFIFNWLIHMFSLPELLRSRSDEQQEVDSLRSVDIALLRSDRASIAKVLTNIATEAYMYRCRTQALGGGEGVYTGFTIPPALRTDAIGSYTAIAKEDTVTLTGKSSRDYGIVSVDIDAAGKVIPNSLKYFGKFAVVH